MADDRARLLRLAREQGATVTRRQGHFRVKTAQGVAFVSHSAVNRSAVRLIERDLRKIGIEKGRKRK